MSLNPLGRDHSGGSGTGSRPQIMGRLALLVSGCSVFLIAGWLWVGSGSCRGVMTSLTSYGTAGQQPNTYKNVHDEGLIDGIRGHHALPKDAAKRITAAKVGLKHLQVKRRRPTKGIMVDRKNITEIVTLEDLQAPEGRLWIPAAIVGPVNTGSSEPLYNVLVSYCQLDMKAYHETPWMFAMGTFHQRQSGCYDDKSLVRAYRLSALKELVDANPDAFLDPSGFIYHETRCGSTLSANMMAAVPTNIVHSETPPPTSAISVCSVGCSDELKGVVIQTVFRLMGPAQQGHTNTFFKFQSSKFVSDIEKAWPGVPWIYLFRDPLEVMASNLKGAWRKAAPTPTRNDTMPPAGVYNMGGPCVRAVAKPIGGSKARKPPRPEELVYGCAKQLESLNQVALDQIRGGSPNGLVVEYRQLPEVMTEYVYPVHFGMASSKEEKEEYKVWMEPVTHFYSKGMATAKDGAVSKEYEQGMDLEVKEVGSDAAMRIAARQMCDNYRTLVSMQKWHKDEEGDTMGTCNR